MGDKNDELEVRLQELIEMLSGDEDIIKQVIDEVISDEYEEQYIDKMEKLIKEGEFQELQKLLHKFKGGISNFGGKKVIDIIRKLKEIINSNDMEQIENLFYDLRFEFKKLKMGLIVYKNKHD